MADKIGLNTKELGKRLPLLLDRPVRAKCKEDGLRGRLFGSSLAALSARVTVIFKPASALEDEAIAHHKFEKCKHTIFMNTSTKIVEITLFC